MRPKIGIIVCGIENSRQFVSNAYIHATEASGGIPLIIPFTQEKSLIYEYIRLCDGFLFCGGGDITPLLFKEEPQHGIGETNLEFDLFQIRIMKQALESHKPILAICRGIQLLNVACGGTLLQDISSLPDTLNHMQHSHDRKDPSHSVYFTPNTILHPLMKGATYVNSFHHQAINQLGQNLIVSGTSPDGIIEAIEMPSHPFVIGVQWHPECMCQTSSKMRNLFHAFIHYSR